MVRRLLTTTERGLRITYGPSFDQVERKGKEPPHTISELDIRISPLFGIGRNDRSLSCILVLAAGSMKCTPRLTARIMCSALALIAGRTSFTLLLTASSMRRVLLLVTLVAGIPSCIVLLTELRDFGIRALSTSHAGRIIVNGPHRLSGTVEQVVRLAGVTWPWALCKAESLGTLYTVHSSVQSLTAAHKDSKAPARLVDVAGKKVRAPTATYTPSPNQERKHLRLERERERGELEKGRKRIEAEKRRRVVETSQSTDAVSLVVTLWFVSGSATRQTARTNVKSNLPPSRTTIACCT